MNFSRTQITVALRQADRLLTAGKARTKRTAALELAGVNKWETVERLLPTLLAKRGCAVAKAHYALEHLGFAKRHISVGIWAAIGAGTVRLRPGYILRRS